MKRLVLCTCLAGALAAFSAPSALGFAANYDYTGHVKGEPNEFVGFFVKQTAGQRMRVAGFTVTQIPYTCSDAPSDVTAGWKFQPSMRVNPDRTFAESGDWTGLPLDPIGRVSGKLRRGGVAAGGVKLRGGVAGPGEHRTAGGVGRGGGQKPPPPWARCAAPPPPPPAPP